MSVKITRSVEKRNTSLRDFLLAATLPLLIFSALGFVIGSNRSGDAEKNAAELSQLRSRYQQLETEHGKLNYYLGQVDSLRKELNDELAKLAKERSAAFSQVDLAFGTDPVGDWWGRVNAVQTSYNRELKALEGRMEGEQVLSRLQIAIPVELFTDYNAMAQENFRNLKEARERYGINDNECAQKIEEMENEHRDQIAEMKMNLLRSNDRVDGLSDDKERLTNQLSSTGKVICPDNSSAKSQIKNSVNEIVATIDALDARRGLLRWSRETQERIDEAKVDIKKHSQDIRDQASEVR